MDIRMLEFEGDTWAILKTGSYSAGAVYCHLSSATRFREQKNGKAPLQIAAYIEAGRVEEALSRPRGFFSWNRSLRGAFERGERDMRAGGSLDDCPYADARKANGQITWSRAFRAAWRDGFLYAAARREHE
jgi:hypothetical protein